MATPETFPPTPLEAQPKAPLGSVREATLEPDSTPPKMTADNRSFLEHLQKINETFYDQIRIADQKAAYIFTFMVAFLVTSQARAVFGTARYRSGDPVLIALSAALAISMLIALVSAILVVLPRNSAVGSSLYWNAWPANRAKFLSALERDEPSWLFNEYLSNVDALSAIARKKYRYVSWSFRALVVSAVSFCFLLGMETGG